MVAGEDYGEGSLLKLSERLLLYYRKVNQVDVMFPLPSIQRSISGFKQS